MSRFSVGVSLIFILGCGAICSSASTAYSVEDKLKELESRLETKINLLKSKNIELEEKVTQLGTQLERNNESRDELALQVAELKTKVQEQETVVSALLRKKNEWKAAPADSDVSINTNNQSPVAVNGLPSSCADLKSIGHIWSGFYSVMGNTTMESVYCDFTKLPSDAGFQKWIGYAGVKSALVYFHATRSEKFNTIGLPVNYTYVPLNIGNALDMGSGIFTAPRSGIYFFSFTGQVEFPASSSPDRVTLQVMLLTNAPNEIGRIAVTETNTVAYQRSLLTLQATVNLNSGEQIWLMIINIDPGTYLNGDGTYCTFFTGFLLEEDIVASL